jgi:transposase-like protein
MQRQYSEEFKKSAVQKILLRGGKTIDQVCSEIGITNPSFYEWKTKYGSEAGMKKPDRRPQDWTAPEKLKAVIEFEGLVEEKRGEFLRKSGLHSEHVEGWKKSMQAGLESTARDPATRAELSDMKAKNKELERDLNRKNKALAETTALLVLKKKADLLWGTGENE